MSGSRARAWSPRHRTLLRVSTVLTIGLLATITVLGLPLRTGAAPLGIVSLQFASSPEAAQRMVASWSSVPRERILWAHGLDLFLPVAYVVAIGLAAMLAGERTRRPRGAAGLALGAAVAAAVADQVENIAMGFTLLRGPSWPGVLLTLVAATAKSALLILALGALAMSSVVRGRVRVGR